jgi:hypothetical protein
MSDFLYNVQQKNRLSQKGILKRFSIECYGTGVTKEDLRKEKADAFQELKKKQNTVEYDRWFLKYRPTADNIVDTEYKQFTEKELLSMLKKVQKSKKAQKNTNSEENEEKKAKKTRKKRKYKKKRGFTFFN